MKSSWSISERLCLFVASGFGIGLFAPFAPGTFGSAAGVALAYFTTRLPLAWQIAAAAALAVAAVPICSVAERILGVKDDGRIAADEWMLFPVAVIGIPVSSLPWWNMAAFFVVVRVLDILKPPPAWQMQSVKGGLGIVLDDLAANLYSLGVNWALYVYLFR